MQDKELIGQIEKLKSQIDSQQKLDMVISELKNAFKQSNAPSKAVTHKASSTITGDSLFSLSSNDNLYFSTFVDDITDGVVTVDQSGTIISTNQTALQLLGKSFDESVDDNLINYTIDYDSFLSLFQSYQSYNLKKYEKAFAITLKGSQQSTTFCEITITKSLTETDEKYVVTFNDVTEQLMAEYDLFCATEKLHEAEGELRLLSMVASKTSNAVIIMDAARHIEWVNDGFTRIFGYTLEEVIGKRPGNVLQGPESEPGTLHQINERASNQESFSTEVINYHKDGTKKWLKLDLNPVFDDEGNLTNFISIETDITETKLNERALEEAKEKAESAARAKAHFLSTMSHEIRTPMNAVIGMSNLLLEEDLPARQREYIDTLKFSSDNLLNLINDILDFSKIEAGKINFESIQFDLHHLVKGIRESNTYMAQEKGITVDVLWDEQLPEHVYGDPTRLGQILNNLTSNAVKFTERGGVTIDISLSEETTKHQTIVFAVRDTGIGIAPEDMDSIFDSFTQSDIYVTRKYGGTGLGLTITKQLVELQAGKIRVDSKVGEGSVFTVTLQFDKVIAKGKLASKKRNEQASLEGYKILLVEDNQVNQFVAAKFLDKWKCSYQIAENGQQALDVLESHQFDLILMDLQMPVKDGFATTRHLRSSGHSHHRHVPIIALTAGNVMEVHHEAMEAGMNDFVTKPFNPIELFAKISKQLRQQ